MSESEGGRGNVRSLTDALRRARIADADRTDVVVELREAERARLDMLADELRGVFSELPPDDEQFVNAVVPGDPPRLWIDATSFVVIGRDRRIYRFLKDTRLGRTVILETASLDDMADAHPRVQRRIRILKHDLHVAPRLPQPRCREPEYVFSAEEHLTGGRLDQAKDAAAGRALAAA